MVDYESKAGFTDGAGNNVKGGDRVEYRYGQRTGLLLEALQDGDAYVEFDDTGEAECVKWKNLCKSSSVKSIQSVKPVDKSYKQKTDEQMLEQWINSIALYQHHIDMANKSLTDSFSRIHNAKAEIVQLEKEIEKEKGKQIMKNDEQKLAHDENTQKAVAPKTTTATPGISLTIPYRDAYNLSQGSVWSEMGVLHELEALLGKAVAQVGATGKQVSLVLTVDNK